VSRFRLRSNALLGASIALAALSLALAAKPMLASPAASAAKPAVADKLPLTIPVEGITAPQLRDNFEEGRGKRKHEAIDILAPRGTPVVAAVDGKVAKLFTSAAGGTTIYQFDVSERFIYYYAHLERYAPDLREGASVRRGEVIGFVGTSGNAPKNTPHLHFTIFRATPEKKWWKGDAVNPYPYLIGNTAPAP
jgi:murein DD-endopeptidase MepM/ murein hydrolase activator NlpD